MVVDLSLTEIKEQLNLSILDPMITVILGLICCNIDTSQRTVDVKIESDTSDTETNETVFLVKDAPVPAGGSLELLAGNKVVMQATDVLKIDADVAAKIDATLSIMEIT